MRWPFARDRGEALEQVEPQAAYALWAATYPPRAHNQLMEIEQRTVLSLLPDLRGRTVLDAGCGSGRYLLELGARGATAIGVDLSMPMLAHARLAGPRIARADVCALPIHTMSIDAVVCGLALGDVRDLEIALAEMSRVLRPGGMLVYSVVHPVGAAAGWQRTFDASGRRMAISGFWHSEDEHRRALAAAGLRVTAWEAPVIREAPDHPAVLVVRASHLNAAAQPEPPHRAKSARRGPREAGPKNAAAARQSHSGQAPPGAAEPR